MRERESFNPESKTDITRDDERRLGRSAINSFENYERPQIISEEEAIKNIPNEVIDAAYVESRAEKSA